MPYGNKFTLITDHRPLVHIFSPNKSLPVYSAMRMQHYAIFLQGFNYTIIYRKSHRKPCECGLLVETTGKGRHQKYGCS